MAPLRRSTTRARASAAGAMPNQSPSSSAPTQIRTRSESQRGKRNGEPSHNSSVEEPVPDPNLQNTKATPDSAQSEVMDGTTLSSLPAGPTEKKRKRPEGDISSLVSSPSHDASAMDMSNGSIRDASGDKATKRARVEPPTAAMVPNGGWDVQRDADGKLPLDRSKLPAELWQYIFILSSPPTLARLARVNRAFHKYLGDSTEINGDDSIGSLHSSSDVIPADAVWAASRALHYPDMPKPLEGLSETAMWRLLAGVRCQFCGKPSRGDNVARTDHPWGPELGEDGTAAIWAFGVHTCGACLVRNCQKEIDLLISSVIPSPLLAAVPFIFLTTSAKVITATALRVVTPPATLQMTKFFYKNHLDDLKDQFEKVKARGGAATEEWFKGLQGEGGRRMADAARWERWELDNGLRNVLSTFRSSVSPQLAQSSTSGPGGKDHSSSKTNLERPRAAVSDSDPSAGLSPSGGEQGRQGRLAFTTHPSLSGSPDHKDQAHPPQGSFSQPRVGRTIHEVNELKAARRLAIEQRCLELEPPIEPNVLNHMESFQNALQISTPLTDSAWAVLKPRLLAQREAAEQKENERIVQSRLLQAKYEERRQQEAHLKEVKEVLDREWDEAQSPIRELLGHYADEIIKGRWKEGQSVTNDASPKFAADVLIHVRSRFYRHIAEEDAAAHAARQEVKKDSPNGPPTRKLILENMKWVFDTKIKPFTEQFRKELFLCHVCDNSKFYGFEGVIQHYAAKHTNTLSLGSVVVHWRAEWPEFPPFHPDPSSAKAAYYQGPPIGHHGHFHSGPPPRGSYQHGRYPQSPGPLMQHTPRGSSGFHHFSPGPYGPPPYADHFSGQHQHGPFAPPQTYHGPNSYPPPPPPPGYPPEHPSGYPGSYQGYAGPPAGYQGQPAGFHGYNGPQQGQIPQPYGSPYQSHAYPAPTIGPSQSGGHASGPSPPSHHAPTAAVHNQANSHHLPGPSSASTTSAQIGSGMYQTQLGHMAGIARETWFGTSGIKDLPGSVRAYVVINQVVAKFKEAFPNEPSLAMFIDGMSTHPAMKPIRNVNGLNCKACISNGLGSAASQTQPPAFPSGDRRLYTLPALLSHFQSGHVERPKPTNASHYGASNARMDWKVDMLDLPERSTITNLINAPGMDDHKLQIIAEVFPDAFPRPLPILGPANNTGPVPMMADSDEASRGNGTHVWRAPDHGYRGSPRKAQAEGHEHVSIVEEPDSRSVPGGYGRKGHHEPVNPAFDRRERPSTITYGSGYGEQDVAYASRPRQEGVGTPGDVLVLQHDEQDQREDVRRVGATGLIDPHHSGGKSRHHEYYMRPDSYGAAQAIGSDHRDRRDGQTDARRDERNEVAGRGYPRDDLPDAQDQHHVKTRVSTPSVTMQGQAMIGDGSEDGEVGTEVNREKVGTPPEEMSAAERFLNEFLPGKDSEEEKRPSRDEADAHRGIGPDGEPLQRSRRGDPERQTMGPSNQGPSPIPAYSNVPGADEKTTSISRDPLGVARDIRRNNIYAQSPQSGRPFEPTEPDPRYVSHTVMYQDGRQTIDTGRRPRSRYERYESFRRAGSRARSRSPVRAVHPGHEEVRYRRSPFSTEPRYEQAYRARSPVAIVQDPYVAENPKPYAGPPPVARYRTYADNPRVYEPSYAVPMEYVPVRRLSARSPPARGTYIVESPGQPAPYKYPGYEEEMQGRPVYDSHGHFYRPIYENDGGRRHSNQYPRY